MAKIEKMRKLAFGFLGLVFLMAGLVICTPKRADLDHPGLYPTTAVIFAAFKDGVWLIVGAVVLGNVGEHFAKMMKKPEES